MAEETTNTSNDNVEVKAHALTPDQLMEWGDELTIVEPTVRKESETVRESFNAGDDSESDEGEQAGVTDDGQEEAPEEEYQEPAPVAEIQDPGDFVPGDYSFEVITYDEEGKHPKTHKITSLEQWEELVDSDPNYGTSGALLKAQRLATKMELGQERDERDWKAKKDEFDKYASENKARIDYINNIGAEINYLVSKGKLPKVESKYASADWSDPEVAKQPGVKEQLELLGYMRKENDARRRAGLKSEVNAIDAYNAMLLDKRESQTKDARKAAAEARKVAGSRVASQTPAPMSTSAPEGISIGRGGSLRDLNPGWN